MPRYIDADALTAEFKRLTLGENSLIERAFADGVYAVIDTFPTADVVEVVRCRDCKSMGLHKCRRDNLWHDGDDYCSRGVRRESNGRE